MAGCGRVTELDIEIQSSAGSIPLAIVVEIEVPVAVGRAEYADAHYARSVQSPATGMSPG